MSLPRLDPHHTDPLTSGGIPLSSPIEHKIAWAERVFRLTGSGLSADPEISRLIERFDSAVAASCLMMKKAGMAEICRECEQLEGGSCCGKGIEDRYSGVLLLVNLLLGRSLPRERFDPAGCFFLGPSGCVLSARHVICINYICKKAADSIYPEKLSCLRDCEGEELLVLFLLAERVKTRLLRC